VDTRHLSLLLADDHEMVRLALRTALASLADTIAWHEATNAAGVESCLEARQDLDLALVDYNMPGAGGAAWIGSLRERFPGTPLVVISAQEDPGLVRELVALGVSGFIPKSDSSRVILQAVRLVLSGGTYAPLRLLSGPFLPTETTTFERDPRTGQATRDIRLPGLTERQMEVLHLLSRGLPNKLIARELGLTEGTVKVHLLAIYRVLGARNRTEAVVASQQLRRKD
jgi:DNA-binding NarL/FixJ family response regulator